MLEKRFFVVKVSGFTVTQKQGRGSNKEEAQKRGKIEETCKIKKRKDGNVGDRRIKCTVQMIEQVLQPKLFNVPKFRKPIAQ